MGKLRRIALGIIPLLLIALLAGGAIGGEGRIGVTVGGEQLVTDVDPIIKEGRTLVPLRAIFEALGAAVDYDFATGRITGTKDDTTIVLTLNEKTVFVNGQAGTIDVAPLAVSGRTMVPTRFIAQSLGATVDWSEDANTVRITPAGRPAPDLAVHFLAVGQADCILIKMGEKAMLIDAGNNADADLILDYLHGQGITTLDYAVFTHPHEDHIGAADSVVNALGINNILMPKVSHTSKTYEDLLAAIAAKGLSITAPAPGQEYSLGDASFIILAPNAASYEELNNYSVVLKLTYGSTSFLFTGDAEDIAEQEILAKKFNVKADVLKIGHHGSISSTTQSFLEAVSPEYAVISVGAGNVYGHPHTETLAKLAAAGVRIFRTDECGTVIAKSDGANIAPFQLSRPARPGDGAVDPGTGEISDVYITGTGMRYHTADCSYLSGSKTAITLEAAKARGYTPCSRCHPPE
ncbi:MAG: stalk domain-containing protein [bacterium]|jgi:competence protein ComEC